MNFKVGDEVRVTYGTRYGEIGTIVNFRFLGGTRATILFKDGEEIGHYEELLQPIKEEKEFKMKIGDKVRVLTAFRKGDIATVTKIKSQNELEDICDVRFSDGVETPYCIEHLEIFKEELEFEVGDKVTPNSNHREGEIGEIIDIAFEANPKPYANIYFTDKVKVPFYLEELTLVEKKEEEFKIGDKVLPLIGHRKGLRGRVESIKNGKEKNSLIVRFADGIWLSYGTRDLTILLEDTPKEKPPERKIFKPLDRKKFREREEFSWIRRKLYFS